MCESFDATPRPWVARQAPLFRTDKEAGLAIFDFVDGCYNLDCRQFALSYRSRRLRARNRCMTFQSQTIHERQHPAKEDALPDGKILDL
jgi:hypothetical protein